MERLPWVLVVVFGVTTAILFAIVHLLRLKITKKTLDDTEETLKEQKEITKTFSQKEVSEIQQNARQDAEVLQTAEKEAQTSAEPIKKSINLGNSIVDSFNNDKL